ncbi:MAG: DNA mismatch endonuclease Vsr [Chloroflexi bacterium]|nr:DNA mismatch endonuclease Vsr [Chloroflexota bacterium]
MRTVKETSEIMRRVHSKDTKPDIIFRKALWAHGFRYKLYDPALPGKPDLVLPSRKIIVFVDGDFWHGHQWRIRGLTSLDAQFTNVKDKKYWINKISRNMDRDCRNTTKLLLDGWTVLRFWESEIKNNLDRCVNLTLEAVGNGHKACLPSVVPSKTFAEFFAGIGLMRIGLERCGWSVSFANDIDPLKYEMYEGNFGEDGRFFVLDDIHKISGNSVGSVTLATASFPCNDLSLAGSRSGLQGKQSSAFWGFVQILSEMGERRPPILLIENVVGFLTSKHGKDLEDALTALNKLGYQVDALILDAANFVPQSRQRLFIIGVRERGDSIEPFNVNESYQFYESNVRPKALADFILLHPNIRWRLRKLPNQPARRINFEDIIVDTDEESEEWWNTSRVAYLLNQMSPKHRKMVEQMMNNSYYSYGTIFRRVRKNKSMAELRTDGLAGCLRTPRGGSGRQILLKAGGGKCFARLLNPRECARLMGADDYKVEVPLNQALFGFGDAVCVPVIEWLANYYLNPLVTELSRGIILKPQGEVDNESECK